MIDEITVIAQNQVLVLDPASRRVSIVTSSRFDIGEVYVPPEFLGFMHVSDVTTESPIISGGHVTDL